jgi:ATP-binding cassette subfamily B protein
MARSEKASAPAMKTSVRRAAAFVLQGYGRAIAAITAIAFIGGVAEALFLVTITRAAFAIKDGQDGVTLASRWFVSLRTVLLVAIILVVIRVALAAYASWQSATISTRVVAGMRRSLSRSFLESSWEVQQAQPSGSLQELLSGYTSQASGLVGSVAQGAVTGANLVALLGTAIVVDPVGALVMVVSVIVLGLLLRPLRSVVRRRAQSAAEAGMDFAISVNEVSELGLELHVFHVQPKATERIAEAVESARKAAARLQFTNGLGTPLYSGVAYMAVVGALGVVAASKPTSLTSLGATMLVMLRSLSYGQATQGALLGISASVPAIEELQRRLDIFETGRRVPNGEPVGRVGTLAVERVTFAYPNGKPVLRDMSFAVMPHEVIGIVGPSGAGKSTLVQLLLGLRDPDVGRILADGRDISTLDRAEWARKVTFVPQAARLIGGTIADNIRFLRDGVTQDDVERAARLAHLHADVEGFPEGYARKVGKHGGHLSGGQQQRLCIARALVEQPDVLILDEPTSALDVQSEHLIRSTLLDLKNRMTVIVIAHRLSTLTICDRIMVITDGELRDFNTPDALEQSSAFYREALVLSGMR